MRMFTEVQSSVMNILRATAHRRDGGMYFEVVGGGGKAENECRRRELVGGLGASSPRKF